MVTKSVSSRPSLLKASAKSKSGKARPKLGKKATKNNSSSTEDKNSALQQQQQQHQQPPIQKIKIEHACSARSPMSCLTPDAAHANVNDEPMEMKTPHLAKDSHFIKKGPMSNIDTATEQRNPPSDERLRDDEGADENAPPKFVPRKTFHRFASDAAVAGDSHTGSSNNNNNNKEEENKNERKHKSKHMEFKGFSIHSPSPLSLDRVTLQMSSTSRQTPHSNSNNNEDNSVQEEGFERELSIVASPKSEDSPKTNDKQQEKGKKIAFDKVRRLLNRMKPKEVKAVGSRGSKSSHTSKKNKDSFSTSKSSKKALKVTSTKTTTGTPDDEDEYSKSNISKSKKDKRMTASWEDELPDDDAKADAQARITADLLVAAAGGSDLEEDVFEEIVSQISEKHQYLVNSKGFSADSSLPSSIHKLIEAQSRSVDNDSTGGDDSKSSKNGLTLTTAEKKETTAFYQTLLSRAIKLKNNKEGGLRAALDNSDSKNKTSSADQLLAARETPSAKKEVPKEISLAGSSTPAVANGKPASAEPPKTTITTTTTKQQRDTAGKKLAKSHLAEKVEKKKNDIQDSNKDEDGAHKGGEDEAEKSLSESQDSNGRDSVWEKLWQKWEPLRKDAQDPPSHDYHEDEDDEMDPPEESVGPDVGVLSVEANPNRLLQEEEEGVQFIDEVEEVQIGHLHEHGDAEEQEYMQHPQLTTDTTMEGQEDQPIVIHDVQSPTSPQQLVLVASTLESLERIRGSSKNGKTRSRSRSFSPNRRSPRRKSSSSSAYAYHGDRADLPMTPINVEESKDDLYLLNEVIHVESPRNKKSDKKSAVADKLKKKAEERAAKHKAHQLQAQGTNEGSASENTQDFPIKEIDAWAKKESISDLDNSIRNFPMVNIISGGTIQTVSELGQAGEPKNYEKHSTTDAVGKDEDLETDNSLFQGVPEQDGDLGPALADSITEWSIQEVESDDTGAVAVEVMLSACNQTQMGQRFLKDAHCVSQRKKKKTQESEGETIMKRINEQGQMVMLKKPLAASLEDTINESFQERERRQNMLIGKSSDGKEQQVEETPRTSNLGRGQFDRKPQDPPRGNKKLRKKSSDSVVEMAKNFYQEFSTKQPDAPTGKSEDKWPKDDEDREIHGIPLSALTRALKAEFSGDSDNDSDDDFLSEAGNFEQFISDGIKIEDILGLDNLSENSQPDFLAAIEKGRSAASNSQAGLENDSTLSDAKKLLMEAKKLVMSSQINENEKRDFLETLATFGQERLALSPQAKRELVRGLSSLSPTNKALTHDLIDLTSFGNSFGPETQAQASEKTHLGDDGDKSVKSGENSLDDLMQFAKQTIADQELKNPAKSQDSLETLMDLAAQLLRMKEDGADTVDDDKRIRTAEDGLVIVQGVEVASANQTISTESVVEPEQVSDEKNTKPMTNDEIDAMLQQIAEKTGKGTVEELKKAASPRKLTKEAVELIEQDKQNSQKGEVVDDSVEEAGPPDRYTPMLSNVAANVEATGKEVTLEDKYCGSEEYDDKEEDNAVFTRSSSESNAGGQKSEGHSTFHADSTITSVRLPTNQKIELDLKKFTRKKDTNAFPSNLFAMTEAALCGQGQAKLQDQHRADFQLSIDTSASSSLLDDDNKRAVAVPQKKDPLALLCETTENVLCGKMDDPNDYIQKLEDIVKSMPTDTDKAADMEALKKNSSSASRKSISKRPIPEQLHERHNRFSKSNEVKSEDVVSVEKEKDIMQKNVSGEAKANPDAPPVLVDTKSVQSDSNEGALKSKPTARKPPIPDSIDSQRLKNTGSSKGGRPKPQPESAKHKLRSGFIQIHGEVVDLTGVPSDLSYLTKENDAVTSGASSAKVDTVVNYTAASGAGSTTDGTAVNDTTSVASTTENDTAVLNAIMKQSRKVRLGRDPDAPKCGFDHDGHLTIAFNSSRIESDGSNISQSVSASDFTGTTGTQAYSLPAASNSMVASEYGYSKESLLSVDEEDYDEQIDSLDDDYEAVSGQLTDKSYDNRNVPRDPSVVAQNDDGGSSNPIYIAPTSSSGVLNITPNAQSFESQHDCGSLRSPSRATGQLDLQAGKSLQSSVAGLHKAAALNQSSEAVDTLSDTNAQISSSSSGVQSTSAFISPGDLEQQPTPKTSMGGLQRAAALNQESSEVLDTSSNVNSQLRVAPSDSSGVQSTTPYTTPCNFHDEPMPTGQSDLRADRSMGMDTSSNNAASQIDEIGKQTSQNIAAPSSVSFHHDIYSYDFKKNSILESKDTDMSLRKNSILASKSTMGSVLNIPSDVAEEDNIESFQPGPFADNESATSKSLGNLDDVNETDFSQPREVIFCDQSVEESTGYDENSRTNVHGMDHRTQQSVASCPDVRNPLDVATFDGVECHSAPSEVFSDRGDHSILATEQGTQALPEFTQMARASLRPTISAGELEADKSTRNSGAISPRKRTKPEAQSLEAKRPRPEERREHMSPTNFSVLSESDFEMIANLPPASAGGRNVLSKDESFAAEDKDKDALKTLWTEDTSLSSQNGSTITPETSKHIRSGTESPKSYQSMESSRSRKSVPNKDKRAASPSSERSTNSNLRKDSTLSRAPTTEKGEAVVGLGAQSASSEVSKHTEKSATGRVPLLEKEETTEHLAAQSNISEVSKQSSRSKANTNKSSLSKYLTESDRKVLNMRSTAEIGASHSEVEVELDDDGVCTVFSSNTKGSDVKTDDRSKSGEKLEIFSLNEWNTFDENEGTEISLSNKVGAKAVAELRKKDSLEELNCSSTRLFCHSPFSSGKHKYIGSKAIEGGGLAEIKTSSQQDALRPNPTGADQESLGKTTPQSQENDRLGVVAIKDKDYCDNMALACLGGGMRALTSGFGNGSATKALAASDSQYFTDLPSQTEEEEKDVQHSENADLTREQELELLKQMRLKTVMTIASDSSWEQSDYPSTKLQPPRSDVINKDPPSASTRKFEYESDSQSQLGNNSIENETLTLSPVASKADPLHNWHLSSSSQLSNGTQNKLRNTQFQEDSEEDVLDFPPPHVSSRSDDGAESENDGSTIPTTLDDPFISNEMTSKNEMPHQDSTEEVQLSSPPSHASGKSSKKGLERAALGVERANSDDSGGLLLAVTRSENDDGSEQNKAGSESEGDIPRLQPNDSGNGSDNDFDKRVRHAGIHNKDSDQGRNSATSRGYIDQKRSTFNASNIIHDNSHFDPNTEDSYDDNESFSSKMQKFFSEDVIQVQRDESYTASRSQEPAPNISDDYSAPAETASCANSNDDPTSDDDGLSIIQEKTSFTHNTREGDSSHSSSTSKIDEFQTRLSTKELIKLYTKSMDSPSRRSPNPQKGRLSPASSHVRTREENQRDSLSPSQVQTREEDIARSGSQATYDHNSYSSRSKSNASSSTSGYERQNISKIDHDYSATSQAGMSMGSRSHYGYSSSRRSDNLSPASRGGENENKKQTGSHGSQDQNFSTSRTENRASNTTQGFERRSNLTFNQDLLVAENIKGGDSSLRGIVDDKKPIRLYSEYDDVGITNPIRVYSDDGDDSPPNAEQRNTIPIRVYSDVDEENLPNADQRSTSPIRVYSSEDDKQERPPGVSHTYGRPITTEESRFSFQGRPVSVQEQNYDEEESETGGSSSHESKSSGDASQSEVGRPRDFVEEMMINDKQVQLYTDGNEHHGENDDEALSLCYSPNDDDDDEDGSYNDEDYGRPYNPRPGDRSSPIVLSEPSRTQQYPLEVVHSGSDDSNSYKQGDTSTTRGVIQVGSDDSNSASRHHNTTNATSEYVPSSVTVQPLYGSHHQPMLISDWNKRHAAQAAREETKWPDRDDDDQQSESKSSSEEATDSSDIIVSDSECSTSSADDTMDISELISKFDDVTLTNENGRLQVAVLSDNASMASNSDFLRALGDIRLQRSMTSPTGSQALSPRSRSTYTENTESTGRSPAPIVIEDIADSGSTTSNSQSPDTRGYGYRPGPYDYRRSAGPSTSQHLLPPSLERRFGSQGSVPATDHRHAHVFPSDGDDSSTMESSVASHASQKARELRVQLDQAMKTSAAIRSTQERLGAELSTFKQRLDLQRQANNSTASPSSHSQTTTSSPSHGSSLSYQNQRRRGYSESPSSARRQQFSEATSQRIAEATNRSSSTGRVSLRSQHYSSSSGSATSASSEQETANSSNSSSGTSLFLRNIRQQEIEERKRRLESYRSPSPIDLTGASEPKSYGRAFF